MSLRFYESLTTSSVPAVPSNSFILDLRVGQILLRKGDISQAKIRLPTDDTCKCVDQVSGS